MPDLTELGQVLHEEHFRILVSICGLENRIRREQAARPLDPESPEDRRLLEDLVADLDNVLHHHIFEESIIFPLIEARGDGALTALLTEEHGIIEPMADRLRAEAAGILAEGSGHVRWAAFRAAAEDLIAEVMRHLQTEETQIVQRLATILDPETDHRLAQELTAERRNGLDTSLSHAGGSDAEGGRKDEGQAAASRRIGMIAIAAQNAARRRSMAPRPTVGHRSPSRQG